MALIGHFQTENHYISSFVTKYLTLFSNDIVFINHRNYSLRSNKYAETPFDFARDIVSFAQYFKNKYTNIVLYGMCGGVPHMIFAANLLTDLNIPYKIIIDRFSRNYIHFLENKTLQKHFTKMHENKTFNSLMPKLKDQLWFYGTYYGSSVLSHTRQIFHHLSKTNIYFKEHIDRIPKEDILILQAKGKKNPSTKEAMTNDELICPENDIRQTLKESRQKNKNVLKNLIQYCSTISLIYEKNKMRDIFNNLQLQFINALELIDNEKLAILPTPSSPTGAHCLHLNELNTRHGLPLQQFLNGFFKKPLILCDKYIEDIITYSKIDMSNAINDFSEEALLEIIDKNALAMQLIFFLRELKENVKFVCHMLNRVSASNMGEVIPCLKELLESELFKLLSFNFHAEHTP